MNVQWNIMYWDEKKIYNYEGISIANIYLLMNIRMNK